MFCRTLTATFTWLSVYANVRLERSIQVKLIWECILRYKSMTDIYSIRKWLFRAAGLQASQRTYHMYVAAYVFFMNRCDTHTFPCTWLLFVDPFPAKDISWKEPNPPSYRGNERHLVKMSGRIFL